jgi:proteic killer suppression protein
LQIEFTNKKLSKVCSSAKEANAKHGTRMSEKLQLRMTQMAAVATLADLHRVPCARCHALTGNLKGKFAVDLVHPDRLLFSPNHNPLPLKGDGGLDLDKITAVMIEGIGDYH